MQHSNTSTIGSSGATPDLSSRNDRTRYGLGTAIYGLAIGAFFAFSPEVDYNWQFILVFAAFIGVGFGAQQLVERSSGTTPRHAKRRSNIGFGTSTLTALLVVLPILNWSAQTRDNSVFLIGLGAFVVAIPSLIAAMIIVRSPK